MADEFRIGGYPLSGIIRRVRRSADLSQRELARYASVSAAMIGQVESGTRLPSVQALQRMLHAANYQLVVVDHEGRLVVPLEVWQDTADGAGRRYPAHLDTILDPEYGQWWGHIYGLAGPPETFRRNRTYRDYQRARSVWEVRVAANRRVRPPRLPGGWVAGDEWREDEPWREHPFDRSPTRNQPGATNPGEIGDIEDVRSIEPDDAKPPDGESY